MALTRVAQKSHEQSRKQVVKHFIKISTEHCNKTEIWRKIIALKAFFYRHRIVWGDGVSVNMIGWLHSWSNAIAKLRLADFQGFFSSWGSFGCLREDPKSCETHGWILKDFRSFGSVSKVSQKFWKPSKSSQTPLQSLKIQNQPKATQTRAAKLFNLPPSSFQSETQTILKFPFFFFASPPVQTTAAEVMRALRPFFRPIRRKID